MDRAATVRARARASASAMTSSGGSSGIREAYERSWAAMIRVPARSTIGHHVSPAASWSRRCSARCCRNGSSRSIPAFSALPPSRMPQMKSVTVMPPQPHMSRSTVVSR